jgi:hypothetical protein
MARVGMLVTVKMVCHAGTTRVNHVKGLALNVNVILTAVVVQIVSITYVELVARPRDHVIRQMIVVVR